MKFKILVLLLFFSLLNFTPSFTQVAGESTYQFLNIPHYNHDFTEIGQFNMNGVRYDDSYLGRDLHTIRSDGLSKRHYHVDIPSHLIDKCKELNIWKVD